jgi:hypothetical protein
MRKDKSRKGANEEITQKGNRAVERIRVCWSLSLLHHQVPALPYLQYLQPHGSCPGDNVGVVIAIHIHHTLLLRDVHGILLGHTEISACVCV